MKMNKWGLALISIGGILISTSPMMNKKLINILMGLTLILIGILLFKKR